MVKLYYHAGACSLAPHIALEWIGAPYETQEVEFGDKEYLKINP
ncbi:MAG: glutathione S-transferase, partial [Alphaproteobacteria bacterium]|nr:glutathione S-transferase [Alphaproteobacteria bacterium]